MPVIAVTLEDLNKLSIQPNKCASTASICCYFETLNKLQKQTCLDG